VCGGELTVPPGQKGLLVWNSFQTQYFWMETKPKKPLLFNSKFIEVICFLFSLYSLLLKSDSNI